MITEDDYKKQVYYVDGELLDDFVKSDSTAVSGVGFE